MKLINAIINRIRGFLNQTAKSIDDPSVNAELVIMDSEKYIRETESKIVDILGKQKEAQRKAQSSEIEIGKYQKISESAASENKLEVAREALAKVISLEKEHATYKTQSETLLKSVTSLREKIKEARQKVEAAKSNHSVLEAKRANLQLTKDVASINNEFAGEDSPLSRLNDFEESIQEESDKLEAALELGSDTSALGEYEKTINDSNVEDRLSELLKKTSKAK